MFVKYSPKVPHMKVIPLLPTKKGSEVSIFDNDSVTLRSGTNELTEKEWEAIQPHIKDLLGKEIVAFSVEVKPEKSGGKASKAKTLKDVPVATARKIIQACQDPATLKKWFNQELPDEILLVLSKQMRKLKIEPDDIEDDGVDTLTDSDITPEDETDTSKTNSVGGDDTGGEDDGVDTLTEEEETGDDEGGDDLDLDDEIVPDFDGSRGGE